MKKIALVLSIGLLSATVLPVQAKGDRPPPPSFEAMDTNGDGELSANELTGPLLEDLHKLDTDHSGTLSKSELPQPPKKQRH